MISNPSKISFRLCFPQHVARFAEEIIQRFAAINQFKRCQSKGIVFQVTSVQKEGIVIIVGVFPLRSDHLPRERPEKLGRRDIACAFECICKLGEM